VTSDNHPNKRMGTAVDRGVHEGRVIRFPSIYERAARKDMRQSTDPIDVAIHYDPASRKVEAKTRAFELQKKEANHPLQKGLQWLGLVE
jgi:hypothetical protein